MSNTGSDCASYLLETGKPAKTIYPALTCIDKTIDCFVLVITMPTKGKFLLAAVFSVNWIALGAHHSKLKGSR